MNPLFQKFAGRAISVLLASALTPAFNWLVAHGYISASDTKEISSWLVGIALMLIWQYVSTHTEQLKFLVAASSAYKMTEAQVEQTVKDPTVALPSVHTPKDELPVPVPANLGRVG